MRPNEMTSVLLSLFATFYLFLGASLCLATDTLLMGTATPGGGFPLYGDAVARAVNETEPLLRVLTQNTKGSTENVPLLLGGTLDLALVQGEVAMEYFKQANDPTQKLSVIAATYSTAGMFAIPAGSPYRTIQDLKGKPVVFGAKGSGLVALARKMLKPLELDPDRDFKAIYLDHAAEGSKMVIEGSAAALFGGGVGWPGFVTLADSKRGARFIVPDDQEILRIVESSHLARLTVPAGSYKGQDRALVSVGSWSYILARPGLSEEKVYLFARALYRAVPALARLLAQAGETTPDNTLATSPSLQHIHPGVLRYYREIGLLK